MTFQMLAWSKISDHSFIIATTMDVIHWKPQNKQPQLTKIQYNRSHSLHIIDFEVLILLFSLIISITFEEIVHYIFKQPFFGLEVIENILFIQLRLFYNNWQTLKFHLEATLNP